MDRSRDQIELSSDFSGQEAQSGARDQGIAHEHARFRFYNYS